MQPKKYSLVLALAAGILCISTQGETDSPRFIEGDLIGPANQALAGMEQVCVAVIVPDTDPNKGPLERKKLKAEVERKLQDAGIRTFVPKEGAAYDFATGAELSVNTKVLGIGDLRQCVLHIQTSLARAVCLNQASGLYFKADVWKTEPVMQAVPVQSMPGKISDLVRQQVEAFILAYNVANAKDVQHRDVNNIAQQSKKQVEPFDEQVATTYRYVASKNSNVFHKPDCRWAKNISPNNLVGYGSRHEAIAAGKKPCKWCKP